MRNNILSFGSVCSGIEAASYVLEPLGIEPVWYSEIAEFPARFLSVKYPSITNLGDMANIPDMIKKGEIEIPDLLCGGTPCQAFSLAGWKNGLNDDRGQLTLKYLDIINEIDKVRLADDKSRCVFFWENVEGVLKDRTNAFGIFLSGLLGLEQPIELNKWPSAGLIYGKDRNVAWRVLDAKYFGVPQQRRRLYVIGGGKEFNPLNVLFDLSAPFSDPLSINQSDRQESQLFDEYTNGIDLKIISPLSKIDNDGTKFEIFRSYSDCVYAAYGTKWNGNAASFNGSLFVAQNDRVRRLTPIECERLMGFPDNYTNLPKSKVTSRYQAIGNSWAIPVIRWIFSRIESGFNTSDIFPDITSIPLSDANEMYLLDGFVPANKTYINSTVYPSDYVLTNMLDILERVTDEKFFLSFAGCSGILRRKEERKAKINSRLEVLLNKSRDHSRTLKAYTE